MSRYWLNPKIDDPVAHAKQVVQICDLYAQAQALKAAGTHLISCDEKTSIQALERAAPSHPTRPGGVEQREFEYIRHGTTCLIANFDVATGMVIAPSIGPTRDEEDFALHIRRTVASDPGAGWIFIADNLTTHVSEALVRLVAEKENLDVDLGVKGKRGILHDVDSRRAFLTDPAHRIRFAYTPKHCSWLNQVEIWFSILVGRVLKRGSFSSVEELSQAILRFIAYFNRLFAKPFKWTYTGRVLAA